MDDENKWKVICDAPRDLFTALPQDILTRIMERLPLHDAAKLSILSRKWMQTWISMPALTFDADFFARVLRNKQFQELIFCNILSLVLLSHIGPISKFYLYIPAFSTSAKSVAIGPLLSFLSRTNVKEVTLKNGRKSSLVVPSHVFSCLDLETLKLDHFAFDLLPSFKGFRELATLELENISFVGNSLKSFIAGCPLLESLMLKNCTGCDSVYITAPNLKSFTISGKFESICFRGAPELIAVSITLEEMVKTYHEARRQELIKFLFASRKVEKLYFGGYFCKFLTAGGKGSLFTADFKCLKVLELSDIGSDDLEEFRCVIGLIQSCPSVEELKISFASKSSADHILAHDPSFSLGHLRKVHIASVMGVSMELKLVEFLLLCAPALEKLSVERSKEINSLLESRMTRELMSFARASPKAKVIYIDPIKSCFTQGQGHL